MLRTCQRIIALAAMLVSPSTMSAQPADAKLTLACQGTETDKGGASSYSQQINIGIIVDFQKKAVLGLSHDSEPVPITNISETTISFAAKNTGWEWHS